MCPQGVAAQMPTRCDRGVTEMWPRCDRGAPPSVSSTNRENPICIQHNPIRIASDRDAPPSVSSRIHRNPYLNPNVDPMSTRCRPKADPMPTQCRPWRHKLIKLAFSSKLWKGQHDVRFGPFETKTGSLKSSSRDLSNGSL